MAQAILSNNRAPSNRQGGSTHPAAVVTKYTKRADENGWLSVKLEPKGTLVALCEYTKVTFTKESGGRTYFRIADGNSEFVGQTASLKTENALKYLMDTPPTAPATVKVKYTGAPAHAVSEFKGKLLQQWAQVSFNGKTAKVTLNSQWGGEFTPIPPGRHRIMAPDRSHGNISTDGYKAQGNLHCTDVWFPIELQGTKGNSSRYIHVGHLSDGCVTFYELIKWNDVYDYLICRRVKGEGGKYVGELLVEK
jgi:hypothetical protein